MNIRRSFSNRLHAGFFTLSLLICLSFCTAVSTNAQESTGTDGAYQIDSAAGDLRVLIDGIVTEVQGTTITLEGGILIDISKATVYQITAGLLSTSLIKQGMCIRASITASSNDPSAPFVASSIRIRVPNEIIMTGLLQAFDVNVDEYKLITDGFITLLNRRMRVSKPPLINLIKRKDLKVGRLVTIVLLTNGAEPVVAAIFPQLEMNTIIP